MTGRGAKTVAWGRVLRLSLLPTALADGLAGFALAGVPGSPTIRHCSLLAASACIYHGAMALNDWADCRDDAETRPERPIPSGLISRTATLFAAVALLSAGVIIASLLSMQLGLWMGGIAALAIGYDLWLRGPLLGPLCLGCCRTMNMAAPIVLLAQPELSHHLPILLGYGVYVFTVSRLARLEELPPAELGRTPQLLIYVQASAFALPLLMAAINGATPHPLIVTILASLGFTSLALHAEGRREWSPELVQAAVGRALILLLVYCASAALCGSGTFAPFAAALILAGYPVANGLRRVFPPT